jgi:hypothetical protein
MGFGLNTLEEVHPPVIRSWMTAKSHTALENLFFMSCENR